MQSELTRELLRATSLDQVIDCSVRILRNEVPADDVAVFLYSKQGLITRLVPQVSADEEWPTEQYSSEHPGSILTAVTSAEDPERGTMIRGDALSYAWPNDATCQHARRRFDSNWFYMLLPLDGPNRTFGVLRLIRTPERGGDFTDTESAQLSVAATRISGTISNLRRDAEITIYANIQKTLASPNISIDRIGQLVAHALTSGATEFATCVVRIADRQNQLQIAGMAALPEIDPSDKSREPREHGATLVGSVLATGEPVIVSDVQSHLDVFEDQAFVNKYGFRTFACFPIGQYPRIIGTISLFVLYPYTFYPTKRGFLEELSRHLATAINVARLLETRSKVLTTQQSVANSVESVEKMLALIVALSVELTGASTGFLSRTTRRQKVLQDHISAWNLPLSAIPVIRTDGPGHTSAAIAKRAPINCPDVRTHNVCGATYVDLVNEWAGRIQSELVVPLLYGGETVGALNLVSERNEHFTQDDELLAVSVAAQAGSLIQRGRFFKSASRLDRLALPSDDRDALYERIAHAGTQLADVELAVVAVSESKQDLLRVAAMVNRQRSSQLHGEPALLQLTPTANERNLRDIAVVPPNDIESTDRNLEALLRGMEQIIVIPLSAPFVADTWTDFGYLLLGAAASLPLFEEERQILTALGRIAAFALKEIELLEERDRAFDRAERNSHLLSVAEIAAGLAHDTNNILNNLSSAFINVKDELKDVQLRGELAESLTLIEEAIDKLATYFGQLRKYKQIQVTNFQEERIQTIVEEAITLMSPGIAKKRVRLRRFFDHIPPVECDREGLIQVFVNLIRNALDAMKERGSLFIGIARHGEFAEVRISDDGSGIDDEAKPQIFDRGFTTKPTGTGIGLTICKQIVEELHRGRLDFDSRRGRGTTFFVRLPLTAAHEVAHASAKNALS